MFLNTVLWFLRAQNESGALFTEMGSGSGALKISSERERERRSEKMGMSASASGAPKKVGAGNSLATTLSFKT